MSRDNGEGDSVSGRWEALTTQLTTTLGLGAPPIAITFSSAPPQGVPAFDEPMAASAADGRTGRVPAGCVFWMKAVDRTFTTVAEDHGNCSVGRVTHGFATLEEVASNADVAALLDSRWVTAEVVPQIPAVAERPGAITYGPLAETPTDPDVVLLRITAAQLMALADAVPDLQIGGKPQCHIVALAKERGAVAASTGCALSRERTGMPATEMTAAIPGTRVEEVVERLGATASADHAVATYAAQDSRRFS
jgi:uncharacterized protein (DUF169 family)